MISLSMIVKNEEKNLGDCLESVKGIVDEIVMVDTGSTDNTKEIAKQYGAKVFDFAWINDFSAARNYSLSKCSGNLILYLDADEKLSEKSISSLKKLQNGNSKEAYNCKIINIDEVGNRPSVMTYVRLFPKVNGIEFTGKVHEQIEKSLLDSNVKIVDSDIEIIHTGYSKGKDELKAKAYRNLDILKDEYAKTNSSYYAFHIGQSYNILEDTKEAEAFFKTGIKDSSLKPEYKSTSLRVLSVYEIEKNNLELALKYVNDSIKYDKDQPLNYMVAAQIYEKVGNSDEEIRYVKLALDNNKKFKNSNYKSAQNIFVDEYLIVCTGLKASLQAGSKENIKYFLNQMNLLTKSDKNLEVEINLLNKIIDGELNDITPEQLTKITNNSNLELLVALFKLNKEKVNSSILFEELYGKYSHNLFVLREFGLFNFNKGELDRAKILFVEAINKNVPDPAIYFYLISIYLQQNRLEELSGILNLVVERFGDNQKVLEKLNILQSKLQQMQVSVS